MQAMMWRTVLLCNDKAAQSFLVSAARVTKEVILGSVSSTGVIMNGKLAARVIRSLEGVTSLCLYTFGRSTAPLPLEVFGSPALAGERLRSSLSSQKKP